MTLSNTTNSCEEMIEEDDFLNTMMSIPDPSANSPEVSWENGHFANSESSKSIYDGSVGQDTQSNAI